MHHGGCLNAVASYLAGGVIPMTCERKCLARASFGPRVFLTSEYGSARRWAQFIDIGSWATGLKSCQFGYFANFVGLVDNTSFDVPGIGDSTVHPFAWCIEIRTERELFKLGCKICPYVGRFVPSLQ